jgi:hypothetical protein
MPKFHVQISQLVRETATVVVEASSLEELEKRLGDVYNAADNEFEPDWEFDMWWSADEGTHCVIDEAPADIVVDYVLEDVEDVENEEASMRCDTCGKPMVINENGTTNHIIDDDARGELIDRLRADGKSEFAVGMALAAFDQAAGDGIDYDMDADHVALHIEAIELPGMKTIPGPSSGTTDDDDPDQPMIVDRNAQA